jgi:hypothetical protein
MSPKQLHDFMHVLYSTREHHAKNEDFPMHILFTRIYLLQEYKLNYRTYYGKKLIMRNLVQANAYDMNMHACNVSRFIFLYIFVNNYFKI